MLLLSQNSFVRIILRNRLQQLKDANLQSEPKRIGIEFAIEQRLSIKHEIKFFAHDLKNMEFLFADTELCMILF